MQIPSTDLSSGWNAIAASPWPFATLRQTLAQLANEPKRDGWSYVFGLPANCVLTRKIWPLGSSPTLADLYGQPISSATMRKPRADQRIPFTIEKSSLDDGQVLLCDLAQPVLFYTAMVADPTKYPALFTDALGWLLASEAALAITGKLTTVQWCDKNALAAIHAAQVAALNAQQDDTEPTTETIAARE